MLDHVDLEYRHVDSPNVVTEHDCAQESGKKMSFGLFSLTVPTTKQIMIITSWIRESPLYYHRGIPM